MNGLPGIEVLFRENRRLANKLTKDELKSLKTYINDRLIQDHEELVLECNTIKSSHNYVISDLKEKIEELEKELKFKNEIIHNYKSSDANLANVYKKRGENLEKRHSVLLEDNEANSKTVKLFEIRVRNLQNELEEYQQKVEEQTKIIDNQEGTIKRLNESQDNVINSEKLSKDLLRVKLAVDEKEREFQKVKRLNAELMEHIDIYKAKCSRMSMSMEQMKSDLDKQTKEFRSKCEQIASLQYQIDLEKRKTIDLQREMQALSEPPSSSRSHQNDSSGKDSKDLSSCKAESSRAHIQYLEGKVKFLEERLALYRTTVRNSTNEVGIITTDCKRLEQLVDRLVVHESTIVEKTLLELRESTETRRCVLEESIDEILQHAPIVISRDAAELKAEVFTLKRQGELGKLNDVVMRCSRLIPRIDACEKAHFGTNDKVINKHWKESAPPLKPVSKARKVIDHTNTTFSGLPKKPPVVPILLRSRTQNANAPLWRRKHSLSMDSVLVSPTLIDLAVSPAASPKTPNDNRNRTFFPPSRPLSAFSNSSLGKTSQ